MDSSDSNPVTANSSVDALAGKTKRKGLRRVLWGAGILAGIWVITALAIDQIGANSPGAAGHYDLIIVAGAGVLRDGTPSWSLQARVGAAVARWKAHLAPKILFTGGTSDSSPTEAFVAARLAREAGVPDDAMILEDRSRTTWENAVFARTLAPEAHSILLVTDSFHIPRARRVFLRQFQHVDSTPSFVPVGYRCYGALREVPATVWYWVKGRL